MASRSSGWTGEPPLWDGRKPDLTCIACGLRFWTYYKIRKDRRCPARLYVDGRLEQCQGKMRKVKEGE